MKQHDAFKISLMLHENDVTAWVKKQQSDNYVCQFIVDRKLYIIDESNEKVYS